MVEQLPFAVQRANDVFFSEEQVGRLLPEPTWSAVMWRKALPPAEKFHAIDPNGAALHKNTPLPNGQEAGYSIQLNYTERTVLVSFNTTS